MVFDVIPPYHPHLTLLIFVPFSDFVVDTCFVFSQSILRSCWLSERRIERTSIRFNIFIALNLMKIGEKTLRICIFRVFWRFFTDITHHFNFSCVRNAVQYSQTQKNTIHIISCFGRESNLKPLLSKLRS